MSGDSRGDDECLRVSDVGQVRGELELVDEGCSCLCVALDSKGKDATRASREVLLCEVVALVARETWVRDPVYAEVLLQPLCQRKGIVCVSLCSERERLKSLD